MTAASGRFRSLPAADVGRRFLVLGPALLVAGIVLALWIRSGIDAANARDLSINTWFHDRADTPGVLRSISSFVSWIGAGSTIVPIELAFVAGLLVFRRWRWAVFVFVSAMGGHLLSNLTKRIVERPRPPWFVLSADQTASMFPSFPSGHTTAGMAGIVAIAITLWFVLPRPLSTITAWIVGLIGLAQGPSRLFLAKHWITDVLGGLLFGAGWLLLVWGAFLMWLAPRPTAVPSDDAVTSVEAPD
jgi:membrane-associated phospholipid phosphatase